MDANLFESRIDNFCASAIDVLSFPNEDNMQEESSYHDIEMFSLYLDLKKYQNTTLFPLCKDELTGRVRVPH